MSFYGLGKQNNLDVINVTFFVMIQLPSSAEFIASKFKNVVFRWQVTESWIVSLIFLRLRNLAHHFIIQKKRNPSKCLNNILEICWLHSLLRKRIEFLGIKSETIITWCCIMKKSNSFICSSVIQLSTFVAISRKSLDWNVLLSAKNITF